ncbi:hypothetical protein M769_0115420 [Bacillus haynesii]|nr:hypothetical protein M769_0115420 [Bacillus haynesii]
MLIANREKSPSGSSELVNGSIFRRLSCSLKLKSDKMKQETVSYQSRYSFFMRFFKKTHVMMSFFTNK